MAGAYAAFPAGGGGGVQFKLERTLGYQSLKYDIYTILISDVCNNNM